MSSIVLGKRTRSALSSKVVEKRVDAIPPAQGTRSRTRTTPPITRTKERLAINGPQDDILNPFVSPVSVSVSVSVSVHPRDQDHHVEDEDAEEEEEEAGERRGKKTRQSTLRSSLPHIGHHFKIGKSVQKTGKGKLDADKENTPQTPRHRDALSKKLPITPRHRGLASQATPKTVRTPSTPSNNPIYLQARQLFARSSDPGKLIGRDDERSELSRFISSAIESPAAGCLYVSGPPGTGKSALLDEVIHENTRHGDIPVSVVNCMSVRNAKDLSQKLAEDLDLKEDAGQDTLKSVFVRGKGKDRKKYLVVLDEVDILVDTDLELLYNLFEWSMQPTSRLILIGIANALDLTDRFLPRLKARNLKPELLPFMPYSATQIAGVITSKLKSLAGGNSQIVPFLQPAAIQFCAKKVAAHTGDLRKAFDICRRAIDLVDQETRDRDMKAVLENSPSKTPLMENVNLSSPVSPSKKQAYTLETAPKATIAHMARVTAQAFSNGATQRLGSLNLQQKAALCALAALERRKRETQMDRTMFATPSKTNNSSAPSLKQLYEEYCTLCRRENIFHALSSVEFRDVISGLETLSLVTPADSKNGSFAVPMTPSRTPGRPKKNGFAIQVVGDERRVASAVSVKELTAALEGPGSDLLKEMLFPLS